MAGSIQSFEDLECYIHARNFRKEIAEIASTFPSFEKFSLVSQMVRSSRSVTANIAEGFGRHHHQENLQFCRQARGSLTETLEHLNVAFDEKYLSAELYEKMRQRYESCIKLLNGYIGYLQRAAKSS